MKRYAILMLLAFLVFSPLVFSQVSLSQDMLSVFEFRNLGAFRAGAWISAIAVPENPGKEYQYTFYAAGRHGGVWKTDNNGTTFYPIFENYGVLSIGALAVAPSDPDILWVGTGESFNARSSHAGNGIYKSTDAGKTFQCMGLKDSQHIPRIIVHPSNPEIVYVASMGHLFTPNGERGVFKSADGGRSWQRVLFLNENTGVIDMQMDPSNPDILYASAYEKYRYPWTLDAGGSSSAVYKTVNGGKNWEKLVGGLPSGKLGRIGLSLCNIKPQVIYALVENLNPKDPSKPLVTEGLTNTERDAFYDQLIGGEIYRSDDGGHSWKKQNDDKTNLSTKAAYSFNQVFCDPNDDNRLYVLSAGLHISGDGGKTWSGFKWDPADPFSAMFGDYRSFWIDPHDSRHILAGSDGGLYVSYDRGNTVHHFYNIPIEEVYTVEVDNNEPYQIYGGLQDHDAWRGPSNSWAGEITLEDWAIIGSGDGMYCRVDNETGRWFYTTGQFGQHLRIDMLNGERKDIMPRREKGKPPYRFTWTTPIFLSPHNPSIVYTGAEVLLRSIDRGDHWEEISPDLTTNDPAKRNGRGHIQYCTITTLSESPLKAGILWVGTDDGKVQVSQDHGKSWNDCTPALTTAGAPRNFWVSRVVASAYQPGRAYITKTGFPFDDFRPVVYMTDDFGKTWKSLAQSLPNEPVNVICEDAANPSLLFLGTDGGAYVSIDGGKEWVKFPNLPPLIVTDLVVHPRENDLVLGTYGRGFYITDISPLTVLSNEVMASPAYLFPVESKPQLNYSQQRWWGNRDLFGNNHLKTPNEPNGFTIYYYLGQDLEGPLSMEIHNPADSLLQSIDGPATKGLHRLVWEFNRHQPGVYRVVLKAGQQQLRQQAVIKERWLWSIGNQDIWRKIPVKE